MMIAMAMLAQTTILELRDPAVLTRKPYAAYGVCLITHINQIGDDFVGADGSVARNYVKTSEAACADQRAAAITAAPDAQKKDVESSTRRFEKMVESLLLPATGTRSLNIEPPLTIELN